MQLLTKELVSNTSAQLFPDSTLSPFRNFLPDQLTLGCQWEVAIFVNILPIDVPKCYRRNFVYFDKNRTKSLEFH